MVFCPRCGNNNVIDRLCANCLKETQPLLKEHKELAPTICTRCKSGLVHGKWTAYKDLTEFIKKYVIAQLKFDSAKTISHVDMLTTFDLQDVWEKKFRPSSVIITVTGKIGEGKEYTEEYELPFVLKKDICQVCNRQASKYFEGIIQIRNGNDDLKRYIHNHITRLNKSGVYLTNVVETKEGVDYYVTDQKAIQQIGHEAAEKFGAHVKITSKLVTKDKSSGKDLYRVTVLLRMPKFGVGDIISYDCKLLRVGRMSKHVHGFDIIRNKHTQVTIKDEEDVTILSQKKTTIMTTHPELTVMDSETFQPVKVYNLKGEEYENGQSVNIVTYNKKTYIIPTKEQRQ